MQKPLGQHVIEVADHGGQLPCLHTLPQQAAGQAADALGRDLQFTNISGAAQFGTHTFEALALHGKQIAFRHHADCRAVADHWHVANPVARHQQCSVLCGVFCS